MIYSENSSDKITRTTITANREEAVSLWPRSQYWALSVERTWPLEHGELGSYFSSAPPINTFTGKPPNFSEPQFVPPQMEIKIFLVSLLSNISPCM